MKTRTDCLAVFLISLGLLKPAHALEPDKLFELVSPSVYLVVTFDKNNKKLGSGSGVVIGFEQAITNCHVLAKASKVLLIRNQESYDATLEYPDPDRDLCQLKVPNLKAPAVKVGKASTLKVGQRVYAVGSPRGLQLSMSDGLVSSLRDTKQGAPQIQTTAPISPGSSGGGLFDSNGLLVGITTWLVRDAQNLNFAYPAEWIPQVPERGKENLAKLEEKYKARNAGGSLTAGNANGTVLPPVDYDLPPNMPQVGDTWTYALIDAKFKPGDRNRKYIHVVTRSSKNAITESISVPGGTVIVESSYSALVEAYFRNGMLEVSPFAASFRELGPNQRWNNIRVHGGDATMAGHSPILLSQGITVGRETTSVAAGQFETIKARFEGTIPSILLGYIAFPGLKKDPLYVTVWYSTTVKRPVKVQMETASTTDVYELESFRLR